MGLLRNVMVKAMLAHQDQCAECKQVFDCEELHTTHDNTTDKNVPICEPCIERLAAEQESQDHDLEAYHLPDSAYEFNPDRMG